jgi:hypothetical protein
MRTVHGQILASTSIDSDGDSIPEEELRSLFNQTPDPCMAWDNHDASKPPICKMYNKRLVRLDNGNLAIMCDLDVIDEEAFSAQGGFSISFSLGRCSKNPDRQPELAIYFNPRVLPKEEVESLVDLSTDEFQIDTIYLKQKSLNVPMIIILSFAGGAIASGFLNELGSDIYKTIRAKLKDLAQYAETNFNTELEYRLTYTFCLNNHNVEVIIGMKSSEISAIASRGISSDMITEGIKREIGDRFLQRVVLNARDSVPMLTIEYYTDEVGFPHVVQIPLSHQQSR